MHRVQDAGFVPVWQDPLPHDITMPGIRNPDRAEAVMFSVTRELTFCYGHRLLDYNGKRRHLHGHNARAVITLAGDQLDRLGMVVDFSHLKRIVGGWLDETLDHKMILHRDDP